MRWIPALVLPALAFSCFSRVSAREVSDQRYLTDLSGGMTLRSGIGGRVDLDGPGGGLRLDFGRHLGHGFWLLGALSWTHSDGKTPADCGTCVRPDGAETFMAGFLLRWSYPFEEVEMYLQAGPGFLSDIVARSGGQDGDPPSGYHQQAAFAGGIGLGFRLLPDLYLGFRADTLFGADLESVSLGGFAGYRFSTGER